MKVFITGGRGMVGRNLCALAKRRGIGFIAPSRQELDLLDYGAVRSAFCALQPDVVIHSAGLVGGIQANIASPYDYCLTNLQIGINVVRAAQEEGVQRLINLGSSCMYPRDAANPLREEQLLQGALEPTNEGYAIAKTAVAKLCEYVTVQHGYRYRTLIPCNLYGCWDDFHPDRSHMIPGVIRKIHQAKSEGLESVEIWGEGTVRREFMFTEDLADFVLSKINHVDQLPQYMNIGVGKDRTINEYYRVIASVIGYEGEFVHDLSKPAGMKQKLVDVTRQTTLGWAPPTSLRVGLEKTYEFFKKDVL